MHPFFAVLINALSIIVPNDGAVMRGFAGTDAAIVGTLDSVPDFSALATRGTATEWLYSHGPQPGEIIENRRWQWRRYQVNGDTVWHTHTETSRERSDFNVMLTAEADSEPFMAAGRREMAFVLADTGTVSMRFRFPSQLVLCQGDTVRNARMQCQTRRFVRHRTTPTGLTANVTEREYVWRETGYLAPLAVIEEVIVETPGHPPVRGSYAYVFPRSVNEEVNTPNINSQKGSGGFTPKSYGGRDNLPLPDSATEPILSYDEPLCELSAYAPGEFTLSVCDIAGRVLSSRRGRQALVETLSHLPSGEYVITIESATGGSLSKKIMLRK